MTVPVGRSGVVAVVGPTGTGKSALGIALAQRLGGEVVNADSMQLYRGMDIGTAKVAPADRGGVAHHGLDLWEVTHPASLAEYQSAAVAAVADILRRSRFAVVVGGSGLYVRALLDRLELPGTDADVRAGLEAELAALGPSVLHRRLAEQDPQAAAAILPGNGRRIVRALEVVALTGSFAATLPAAGEPRWPGTVLIGLDLPAGVLRPRLASRVQQMLADGLVAEVAGLLALGLREGVTARRAVGYAQVLAWLDAGRPAGLAEQVSTATAQLSRRQRSWFRRDPRLRWLDADSVDLVDSAVACVQNHPNG